MLHCKTRTKHRSYKKTQTSEVTINQQQQNHRLSTDISRSHSSSLINFTGQIFAVGSAVGAKTQKSCSLHGGLDLVLDCIYVLLDYMWYFILQEEQSGEITFYLKGADVVMMSIVQYNDWLEEEVGT